MEQTNPLKDLIIPLKGIYFNQIKSGEKIEEFRLCTPYWKKRLEGKEYKNLILTLGYPPKEDISRRLVFPYYGYIKKNLLHPHFGEKEVAVYAIQLKILNVIKEK